MTGTSWALLGAAVVFLGLGGFALVMSIKALAANGDPDIVVSSSTGQSAQMGKGGLVVFVVLGALLAIVGIVFLVDAIRMATGS